MSLDPRDPLHTVIQLKPWHQPRIEVAVAVDGPTLRDRKRLVYGLGRV